MNSNLDMRPVSRGYFASAAPLRTAAPVASPMASPMASEMAPAGEASVLPRAVESFLKADMQAVADAIVSLVFAPFRMITGRIGANAFVRPGMGSAEGQPPSKYGLAYETLNFNSTDGTPLKGWYIPAAVPSDKTIVLAHGHGGQMSDVVGRWARWLHKAGYNVLAFDFRNSGGSGGTKTTMGFEERRDLDAALTQAQAKGGKQLAVMGLSMGAATGLSLAADDPRIQAIVADCSFDTLDNAVASRVARTTFDVGPFKGLRIPFHAQAVRAVVEAAERLTGHTPGSAQGSLRSAEPLRAMYKLQDRPIFLVHGQDDDETYASNSANLARANPNAELWLVPGAKHGESYKTAPREYESRVLAFLNRSFSSATT